jgi:hypothetical protein
VLRPRGHGGTLPSILGAFGYLDGGGFDDVVEEEVDPDGGVLRKRRIRLGRIRALNANDLESAVGDEQRRVVLAEMKRVAKSCARVTDLPVGKCDLSIRNVGQGVRAVALDDYDQCRIMEKCFDLAGNVDDMVDGVMRLDVEVYIE